MKSMRADRWPVELETWLTAEVSPASLATLFPSNFVPATWHWSCRSKHGPEIWSETRMQGREEWGRYVWEGRVSDLRHYTGEDPSVDVTFASAISPTSAQVWPVYVSLSGCQHQMSKASKSLIAKFKCSLGCLKKWLLVVTHASHCQKPTKANQYAFARAREGFIEGTAPVIETSNYAFNKQTQILHLTI